MIVWPISRYQAIRSRGHLALVLPPGYARRRIINRPSRPGDGGGQTWICGGRDIQPRRPLTFWTYGRDRAGSGGYPWRAKARLPRFDGGVGETHRSFLNLTVVARWRRVRLRVPPAPDPRPSRRSVGPGASLRPSISRCRGRFETIFIRRDAFKCRPIQVGGLGACLAPCAPSSLNPISAR